MKTFEIKTESYEDLSEDEKKNASNNRAGKKYARFIRIVSDGETVLLKNDAMEPEDASFSRNLSWVVVALKKCYEIGYANGAIQNKNSDGEVKS